MAIKAYKGITIGKGTPQKLEGRNGDITIRSTNKGTKMYVKEANKWHSIDLDVDLKQIALSVQKLKDQVKKLSTKRNNSPVVDKLLLKQAGGTAVASIKNDAGNINLDSSIDIASGSTYKINGTDLAITKIFKQTAPPTATAAGDMWYDTNDSNKLYIATAAGNDEVTLGEWTLLEQTITSALISDVAAFSQSGNYAGLRAQATTAADVDLGNVDNESKTTMFQNPTFTDSSGTTTIAGATTNISMTNLVATGNSLDAAGDADNALFKIEQTLAGSLVGSADYDHTMLLVNLISTDTNDWDNVYLMDLQDSGATKFKVYENGNTAIAGDLNITGNLTHGDITSTFGAIDNGSSAITTTGVVTGGSFNHFMDVQVHNFYSSSALFLYIPFGGNQIESSSITSPYDDNTLFIAPYDGYLVKVILQSETDVSSDAGACRMQIRINGTLSSYVARTVADDTSATFAFGASDSSWAFTAGDRIRVSFDGGAAPRYITISSVWRYTI